MCHPKDHMQGTWAPVGRFGGTELGGGMLPWEGINSGLRMNQFLSEQWLGVKATAPAWLFLHMASSLSLCLPCK